MPVAVPTPSVTTKYVSTHGHVSPGAVLLLDKQPNSSKRSPFSPAREAGHWTRTKVVKIKPGAASLWGDGHWWCGEGWSHKLGAGCIVQFSVSKRFSLPPSLLPFSLLLLLPTLLSLFFYNFLPLPLPSFLLPLPLLLLSLPCPPLFLNLSLRFFLSPFLPGHTVQEQGKAQHRWAGRI